MLVMFYYMIPYGYIKTQHTEYIQKKRKWKIIILETTKNLDLYLSCCKDKFVKDALITWHKKYSVGVYQQVQGALVELFIHGIITYRLACIKIKAMIPVNWLRIIYIKCYNQYVPKLKISRSSHQLYFMIIIPCTQNIIW